MATQRLPLANPSPVFGLALLLVVLLLGVTRFFSLNWLPAVGLVCVTALECTWHFNHFNVADGRHCRWSGISYSSVCSRCFPFCF